MLNGNFILLQTKSNSEDYYYCLNFASVLQYEIELSGTIVPDFIAIIKMKSILIWICGQLVFLVNVQVFKTTFTFSANSRRSAF